MAKKNFNQAVLGFNGKPSMIENPDNPKLQVPYTFKDALLAVLSHSEGWEKYPPASKAMAGSLAVRLYDAGEGELEYKPEELVFMKERVLQMAPPLTAHRFIEFANE